MNSNIMKTRRSTLALALVLSSGGLLGIGCSAGPDTTSDQATDDASARQARAMEILVDLGVSIEGLAFHEFNGMELVRIHGDLNLNLQALLDGEYGHLQNGGLLVDKAFKSTTGSTPPVSTSFSNNIKLVFAGGSETPFSDDQTLLRNSATSWSTTTFTNSSGGTQTSANLDIRTTNTGATITIHMMPGTSWPNGTPCGSPSIGCIDAFPSGSRPSANIFYPDFLNPFDNANQCEWTTSQLTKTFLHELGHSIGFTHPGNGTQVAGTLPCGAGNPCTTVMAQGGQQPFPNCTNPLNSLRSDDRDAVTTVY